MTGYIHTSGTLRVTSLSRPITGVDGVCKFRFGKGKALKLYFRASAVAYSFMKEPKPSVTEAKIQAVMAF